MKKCEEFLIKTKWNNEIVQREKREIVTYVSYILLGLSGEQQPTFPEALTVVRQRKRSTHSLLTLMVESHTQWDLKGPQIKLRKLPHGWIGNCFQHNSTLLAILPPLKEEVIGRTFSEEMAWGRDCGLCQSICSSSLSHPHFQRDVVFCVPVLVGDAVGSIFTFLFLRLVIEKLCCDT